MIKLIGMYLLMGIIALFGSAIWMSYTLYKLSEGDDDIYYRSLDIVTHIPNSYGRVKKMLSDENKDGRRQYFVNLALNISTFPYAVPIMLSRYPEAKQYIIDMKNVKMGES